MSDSARRVGNNEKKVKDAAQAHKDVEDQLPAVQSWKFGQDIEAAKGQITEKVRVFDSKFDELKDFHACLVTIDKKVSKEAKLEAWPLC